MSKEAELYINEKGGVVHIHFEPNEMYIRGDDCCRLMQEYADQEVKKVLKNKVTDEDWEKLRGKGLDDKLEKW